MWTFGLMNVQKGTESLVWVHLYMKALFGNCAKGYFRATSRHCLAFRIVLTRFHKPPSYDHTWRSFFALPICVVLISEVLKYWLFSGKKRILVVHYPMYMMVVALSVGCKMAISSSIIESRWFFGRQASFSSEFKTLAMCFLYITIEEDGYPRFPYPIAKAIQIDMSAL